MKIIKFRNVSKSAELPKKVVVDINKDNECLLADIDGDTEKLCDCLSEYQKLLIAEAMEATTIEIAKKDKMGFPILNNKYYQGCACTSNDKQVWVFYGNETGEDDKVISPNEFNKNWVITNIIFE